MAQQDLAMGSALEAAFPNNVGSPQTSLLDSIFDGTPNRSAERRGSKREASSIDPNRSTSSRAQRFVPPAPKSLDDAGLSETEVEDLILKFLFRRGVQSGRAIADQLRLPFAVLQSIFQAMKNSQRIVIAKNSSVSDFEYSITSKGIEAAKKSHKRCTYFGAAPVPFVDYLSAVSAQSMTHSRITLSQVETALADLSVPSALCKRIGKALVESKAMFIFGAPGNG